MGLFQSNTLLENSDDTAISVFFIKTDTLPLKAVLAAAVRVACQPVSTSIAEISHNIILHHQVCQGSSLPAQHYVWKLIRVAFTPVLIRLLHFLTLRFCKQTKMLNLDSDRLNCHLWSERFGTL